MDVRSISSDPIWNVCLNLLLDPRVSEVESNGPNEFFIKKEGQRLHIPSLDAHTEEEYEEGIINGLVPHVKAPLPYEKNRYIFEGPLYYTVGDQTIRGRCHIVLSPAAESPQVTIAKKSTSLAQLEDIAGRGSMSTEMLEFLTMAVKAGLTIVVSGPTGAGKTTLLEALAKLIPNNVRVGVAEDTPELVLTQENVTYLHSVPWRPGMDEKDVATLSWVVAQFQRMRVDRLIIGETRGKEFADFLTAANSGMEGSLTTIHANTPTRALEKMTNFTAKGSEKQPIRSINTDIANSIDLVVQLGILPDGRHKVYGIQEITPVISDNESATITTNPLYVYDEMNDRWRKESQLTDGMRKRLTNRKMNLQPFLKAPLGQQQVAHESLNANAAIGVARQEQRRGGLPSAPGRRVL